MQPQLPPTAPPNGAHPIPAHRRKAPSRPSIVRRRWSAGCRVTPRRSSAGAGAAGPRSARSSRWSATQPYFGSFRVRSAGGGSYEVEIRSLDQPLNSCGCADHRVNGLGTCKHIEGVLARLRQRGVRAFRRRSGRHRRASNCSCRAAAIRCRGCSGPRIRRRLRCRAAALAPFLAADGSLADAAPDRIDALLHVARRMPVRLCGGSFACRATSNRGLPMRGGAQHASRRARRSWPRSRPARQTIDMLRHPLLPYQREGMLHLAFGERALLADEMGLGKTDPGDRRLRTAAPRCNGIARVLVVCPASLKARVGGADRALHRAPPRCWSSARAGAARSTTRARRSSPS